MEVRLRKGIFLMKKRRKQSVLLLATTLGIGTMVAPLSTAAIIYAQEEQAEGLNERLSQSEVALGASLNDEQRQNTLALLRASDTSDQQMMSIDGALINQYLADGSTVETQVFSSAVIEPREEGYGVQVQIVTPDTITSVAAQTYQQAAITAGAMDVLIKIAAVEAVTGEGALTGVYAIYDENDLALNPEAVQVAQKEIKLVTEIEETSHLTIEQISQLQTALKLAVNEAFQAEEKPTEAVFNDLTLAVLEEFSAEHDIELTEELATQFITFVTEFAAIETAKNEGTTAQIDASTGFTWTLEQAIDFWEATFIDGPSADDTNLEHYEHDQWQEVENEESVIVLSQLDNEGGERFLRFEKTPEGVLITVYEGEEAYPDVPMVDYRVDTSTFEILEDSSVTEDESDVDASNEEDLVEEPEDEAIGQALWDESKASQLADLMVTWGDGMEQTYESFTPDSPGDMYGVAFPTDVLPILGVNDTAVAANWSPTGEASQAGEYVIVAAYNDVTHFYEANPNAPAGAHFYLFAIVDGAAVVLNSQQNQGMPDGLIHFSPTENMELQAGFESIVNQ